MKELVNKLNEAEKRIILGNNPLCQTGNMMPYMTGLLVWKLRQGLYCQAARHRK